MGKNYNIVYDNGSSTYVNELTKDILQNLENGFCHVYDVTDPKAQFEIIMKMV